MHVERIFRVRTRSWEQEEGNKGSFGCPVACKHPKRAGPLLMFTSMLVRERKKNQHKNVTNDMKCVYVCVCLGAGEGVGSSGLSSHKCTKSCVLRWLFTKRKLS